MALPLSRLPVELLRELRRWRWAALGLIAFVAFGVLAVGFLYPYEYRSNVVIYVDDSNIIRPLMEGSAEITGISDQASAAKELLWSRRVIEQIAEDQRIYGDRHRDMSTEQRERFYARLRNGLNVSPQGDSYLSIRFAANDPREAYLVAQRLGQLFLEESSRRQRAESRNAYEFIDKQVQSYQQQIERTEQELKEFLTRHMMDGTEADANRRLASIRGSIEQAELELEEVQARKRSLERQLTEVPQTISGGASRDQLGERIASLQQRLDDLRLSYHDTYPDVIAVEEQLAELRERRRQLEEEPPERERNLDESEQLVNPFYQDVQTELSRAETLEQSLHTRIRALQRRLASEEERMERIQANKAEHNELTRDLQVNQDIFNDLLKRRERARVSMHLDMEGQGLSFQIHEQAQYPLDPSGLQFENFASVGWLLGLLAPFGLLTGVLQIDPRVRSGEQIREDLDIPLLGGIPNVKTPYERRRARRGYVGLFFIFCLIASGYVAVVALQSMGVLA